jgi:peptide/nickel transport system ATP-binding protein
VSTLLAVEDLRVSFQTEEGRVTAVDSVSFDLRPGEVLAVVGESGCGKSVTAMSLMGLTRGPNATISGRAMFKGTDLMAAGDAALQRIRGNELAMIFQDPMTSLNPVHRVGDQIIEQIQAHRDVSTRQARQRAIELLDAVGIPDARARAGAYPHEFSGGMRQRVMIAMALSLDPAILIADEPTTALDVTVQAQILELLGRLNREQGLAMMLITHDLGVVAQVADRVVVMYAGRVVETGTSEQVFHNPQHPYTWGLLGSVTRLDRPRTHRLPQVAGQPPSLVSPPEGCHFRPRCPHAFDRCTQVPPLEDRSPTPGHADRCWMPPETKRDVRLRTAGGNGRATGRTFAANTAGLLEVTDLTKHFPTTSGLLAGRRGGVVRAVDGVSFSVAPGETLGLVGESGCGKSTLARTILQLLEPTAGSVRFDGREIVGAGRRALRPLRSEMQIIFQDPYASLNPRKRVGQIVGQPLVLHGRARGRELRRQVEDLLDRVGLAPEHYHRFPHEFSGGQRQRIGIARALALRPRLIIADEPVSALDVSIQAQIINLLDDLQDDFGLTSIFVAHDLGVVRHVADRVAVMNQGKIVEIGPADELYANPAHPYTKALLSAVPIPDPQRK